jgi:hypothetical protein
MLPSCAFRASAIYADSKCRRAWRSDFLAPGACCIGSVTAAGGFAAAGCAAAATDDGGAQFQRSALLPAGNRKRAAEVVFGLRLPRFLVVPQNDLAADAVSSASRKPSPLICVIGVHHLAQIFRVQLHREFGKGDQIAEHHR